MNELIAAYKAMWLNIFNFKDRTSVKDYWLAFLATFVVTIAVCIVFSILIVIWIAALASDARFFTVLLSIIIYVPLTVYSAAAGIALIAAGVRRLHDAGFSGWMYLINFVPTVGQIALIVFFCMPSTEDTKYGPKEIESVTASPNNTDNQI